MEESPFWKPKFIQTAFAQMVSTIALFSHHISESTWQLVTMAILSIFTVASVVENKLVPPLPMVKDKA